jgi:hypothetical protein
MNPVLRIGLIAFLLLVITHTTEAQQDRGIVPSPPAKIEGKFAIADFGNERTVVSLAHQSVGGEKACAIWVSAGYTYVGKAPESPERQRVYISFVRDSTDEPKMLRSETERTLVLILDGETLNLGPMPSVKEVMTGYSLATQGLMLPMPYETFRKVANAKKVEVHLGPLTFNLTERNLQDFRDLQGRISR